MVSIYPHGDTSRETALQNAALDAAIHNALVTEYGRSAYPWQPASPHDYNDAIGVTTSADNGVW